MQKKTKILGANSKLSSGLKYVAAIENMDQFIHTIVNRKACIQHKDPNPLQELLPRKNQKHVINKIDAYRVIAAIKNARQGISRNDLITMVLSHTGNSNKENGYYITSILSKLAKNHFVYCDKHLWFPSDDLLFSSLMASDVWKLTCAPFKKANYFYFFQHRWRADSV